MNKKSILCLYALFILSVSCNNNKTGTNTTNEPTNAGDLPAQIDTVSAGQTDTLIPKKSNAVTKGTEVKKEDPSLQNTAHQSPAVKRYLQELKKSWKNTPNPLIATYEGNDFGDYQHIIFKDAKGNTYDFGQAANSYGKYQLHEASGQYADNQAYLGKKFKVYWEWKLTDFLCCEGEYDKVKGYLPAITKLELIKN